MLCCKFCHFQMRISAQLYKSPERSGEGGVQPAQARLIPLMQRSCVFVSRTSLTSDRSTKTSRISCLQIDMFVYGTTFSNIWILYVLLFHFCVWHVLGMSWIHPLAGDEASRGSLLTLAHSDIRVFHFEAGPTLASSHSASTENVTRLPGLQYMSESSYLKVIIYIRLLYTTSQKRCLTIKSFITSAIPWLLL